MKKIALSLFVALFASTAIADAPVQSRCYELRLSLPADLTGTGLRKYLPAGYGLCLSEKNVVKEGNISTGEFSVSITSGDFLLRGYRLAAKSQVTTMESITITYAKDTESLETAPPAERVRVSLGRNSPRPGVFVGQISIGGAVFGLFGEQP